MDDPRVQAVVRWLLIIWFILASACVFLPAGVLLVRAIRTPAHEAPPLPSRPALPPMPAFDASVPKDVRDAQIDVYKKDVDAQLSAYDKQAALYKDRVSTLGSAAATRGDLLSAYEAVVDGVLKSLVQTVLASFLAFAFVKVAVAFAKRLAGT